jgi:hypothetical protein
MPIIEKPAAGKRDGFGFLLGSKVQPSRVLSENQRLAQRLLADARSLIGASEHANLALAAHFGAQARTAGVAHV